MLKYNFIYVALIPFFCRIAICQCLIIFNQSYKRIVKDFFPFVPTISPKSNIISKLAFPALVSSLSDIEIILPFVNTSFKMVSASSLLAPMNFCPFPPVVDKCLDLTYASSILKLSNALFPAIQTYNIKEKFCFSIYFTYIL